MVDQTWPDRVAALVRAMSDVRGESLLEPRALAGPYLSLFDRYVRDLRSAKRGAERRWDDMVSTEFGRTGDPTAAERNVAKRNPVGRVADPGVIAVLRRYWLACDALNQEVSAAERIPPEHFLLSMLLRPPNGDLARFVSDLPYWPIGLDGDGRWV